MKKNKIIIPILFLIGLTSGYIYNQRIREVKDQPVSGYNWISRYDLYDYEEAVLKEGNYSKMADIVGEAGVDRLPYVIVEYDVYNKKDAGYVLLQLYLLYQSSINNHNKHAMVPLTDFVKDVITESSKKGYDFNSEHIKEFKKYE